MASSDMTIDNLQIQIETQASKATGGIDALAESMEKLKIAVGDSNGLASNLTQISNAIKTFSGISKINLKSSVNQLLHLQELVPVLGSNMATTFATNLKEISSALQTFSAVPKVSIAPIANGLRELNSATASLDSARIKELSAQMQGVTDALSLLGGIGKTNLNSTLNALKKIPEISQNLKPELITEFATKIKQLTEAIRPLSTEMDKIGRGFAALPQNIQRAIKASNAVTASNGKMKNSFNSLTTSLSMAATKFWILYQAASRIVDIFADCLNESNDYIESLNLFKVTMGDASDEAMSFAESVRDVMGIDISEWITNQGVFQRMATGFGIAADQANVMSQNLTQLAYDLSSFFNTDVETAMQKLQSGMSGQIKGLKAWGYNLSVAALQETALSLGIEQSVRTMTEAQKAQLRYITLIQKSNGIMGDMAKTLTTPANAMRILSSQITQLKRAFGDIVSVLVTRVIPYVQAFVKLMTEAANALAKIMGFSIKDLPSNNLDMGSDVIDGIGDSANDTEEDLKALKKQLAGFDELNILKDDSKDKELSYDLGIALPSYDFLGDSPLSNAVDEIIEDFKELIKVFEESDFSIAFERIKEFVQNIKKQFDGLDFGTTLMEDLSSGLETVGSAVNLVVQVAAPLVESLNIPEVVHSALKTVGSLFNSIGDIVRSVTPMLTNFSNNALAPIAGWIGESVIKVFESLGRILGTVGGIFRDMEPSLTKIGTILGELVGKVWEFLEPLASEILDSSLGGIEGIAGTLDNVVSIVDYLADCLSTLWTILSPIIDILTDVLSPLLKEIGKFFGDKIDSMVKQLRGFVEYFTGVFTGDWGKAMSGIRNIFEGTFDDLVSGLKFVGNGIIAIFEGIANKFVDAWNWIKKGLNSLSVDVPEWLGGGTFGFNFQMSSPISIPRFEMGGFPSMGEMFIAREAGPELVGRIGTKNAVVNNNQIISGIATAVYNAMMAAQEDSEGSGGNAKIVVQIGDQAVGEASVRYINGKIVQTGMSPIYG